MFWTITVFPATIYIPQYYVSRVLCLTFDTQTIVSCAMFACKQKAWTLD